MGKAIQRACPVLHGLSVVRDCAGYGLGPGSWDTAVEILASAVADESIIQAADQQIPLDAVDVIFTSHPSRTGP